jgi:hypothetical protein
VLAQVVHVSSFRDGCLEAAAGAHPPLTTPPRVSPLCSSILCKSLRGILDVVVVGEF